MNRCRHCGFWIVTDEDVANGAQLGRTSAMHWRSCESKRDWPAHMRVRTALVDAPLVIDLPVNNEPRVRMHMPARVIREQANEKNLVIPAPSSEVFYG